MSRIKRKKKIGYKCLSKGFIKSSPKPILFSWRGCNNPYHHGVVVYKPQVKTYKLISDGPLAVFNTLPQAKEFTRTCGKGDEPIYRCEYRESIHRDYWFAYKKRLECTIGPLPAGKKFADWIKLIEKVV